MFYIGFNDPFYGLSRRSLDFPPLPCLGLPSAIGKDKTSLFSYIVERARLIIQWWKGKLLSHTGKEILLKLVIATIPFYAMSCFLIPDTICKAIKSTQQKFCWGSGYNDKKINWVALDTMQKSKRDEGKGFRDLHHFNLSLLDKQVWRIIQQPESL